MMKINKIKFISFYYTLSVNTYLSNLTMILTYYFTISAMLVLSRGASIDIKGIFNGGVDGPKKFPCDGTACDFGCCYQQYDWVCCSDMFCAPSQAECFFESGRQKLMNIAPPALQTRQKEKVKFMQHHRYNTSTTPVHHQYISGSTSPVQVTTFWPCGSSGLFITYYYITGT